METVFLSLRGVISFFRHPVIILALLATLAVTWAAEAQPNSPPVILQHPAGQTVPAGSTVTMSVEVGGTPPFFYRWLRFATILTNATGPTLTLFDVQTNQTGLYSVVVTNQFGFAVSSNALLIVTPNPSTNRSPMVQITFPANAARFTGNIPMTASALDPDGTTDLVEFFANGTKLGQQARGTQQLPGEMLFFNFTWTNPPPGSHQLTAHVRDNFGRLAVSAPVNVVVEASGMVPAQNNQEDPAIAASSAGFFVVWADKRNFPSTDVDIYGARVSRDGVVLDPTGIPICRDPGHQIAPRIAYDGTGYLVVWADDRESTPDFLLYQIYGARIGLDGVVRDTNGFKISGNFDSCLEPAVASNGQGFLTVWTQSGGDGPGDIYGTTVSSDGVVTTPVGAPLAAGPFWQMMPRLASARGEYLLTFWGESVEPGLLHGRRLSANATPLSAVFPIDFGSAEGDRHDLASNGRDYFAVWGDFKNSAHGDPHVFGSLIRSNGIVVVPGGLPIATNTFSQHRPAVAADGNNFLVTWQESDTPNEEATDLFGARISSAGFVTSSSRIPINRSPGVQYNPAVAFTPTNFLVAWQDGRTAPDSGSPEDSFDIYGTIVLSPLGLPSPDGFLISGRLASAPPVSDLDFHLTFFRPPAAGIGGLFTVDYTLEGPDDSFYLLPAMRMETDGGERYYYGTDGPGIRQATRVDSLTGVSEPIVFTTVPEDLGWEMGVSYDSLRHRMALATLGGEGFLYGLPEGGTAWSTLGSLNNLDLDCLAFHAASDAFYGVRIAHGDGLRIYKLGSDGSLLDEFQIPGVPFDVAPGEHRSELVAVGDYLVLLLEPESYFSNAPFSHDARIYLLDPSTGESWLTFHRDVPPPNPKPNVSIDSPANHDRIAPGHDVTIRLSAGDPDGSVEQVEVLLDGSSLGLAHTSAGRYELVWSNPVPGDHWLTAIATDNHGATNLSAPSQVFVVTSNAPPPLPALPLLVTGSTAHSVLFIDAQGQLYGTGRNETGQMGTDDTAPVLRFRPMTRPARVNFWIGASAQYFKSYAIGDDHMIYRWGLREGGEPEDVDTLGPVPEMLRLPPEITGWSQVSAGTSHALALANDGQLYSWGDFGYGQLGYHTDRYSTIPRRVPMPRGVQHWTAIAAGGSHSLAIANDGRLFAWGRNYEGELGLGFLSPGVTNPLPVIQPAGVSRWIQVMAGGAHTMALANNGRLYGFGYNVYRMADGGSLSNFVENLSQPVPLPWRAGVTSWAGAGLGIYHSATLASDGRLFTWGEANYGQLGIGDVPGFGLDVPTLVPFPAGVTGWRSVAAGFRHTVALGNDCRLYAWGHNASGQLGIGSTNDAFTPVLVPFVETPDPALPVVIVSATDRTGSEGGTNPIVFTVFRTPLSAGPLSVKIELMEAFGSNRVFNANITIPGGTNSADYVYSPVDDNLVQGTHYVYAILVATDPPTYTIGSPSQARGAILDNDTLPPPPIVTVEARDDEAAEGGTNVAVFTFRRTPVTDAPLQVSYSMRGTASNGLDYIRVTNTVDFAPGQESADVIIRPIDDDVVEGIENVIVYVSSIIRIGNPDGVPVPPPYVVGDRWTAGAYILDNDRRESSPITLVATGSVWKYLPGGPAPAGWTDLNFDDGTWAAGAGQLGYGDGDETTVIPFGPDSANKFITTYFRRAFRTPIQPVVDLTMRVLRDDGVIIYLNGTEVFRNNMPPGPVTSTTLALTAPVDENAYLEVTVPDSWLDPDELNILAAEIHQVNVASSDAGFDLGLTGEIELDPGPDYPPYLNIYVSDRLAAEYGTNGEIDPGGFFIFRDGSLRDDLLVDLEFGGDATPGEDYVRLPNRVLLPAGQKWVALRVDSLPTLEAEPLQIVTATLLRPSCQPTNAGCYIVGGTNRASLWLKETAPQWNNEPAVTMVTPTNHAALPVNAAVQLAAVAIDPDFPYGDITQVQFFANGQSVGYGGRVNGSTTWSLTWNATIPGTYAVRAVATDGLNLTSSLTATSAPIQITILGAPPCQGTWASHGVYVRAVIEYAWRAFRSGLINDGQRRTLIREAVLSNCGRNAAAAEPLEALALPLTREECQRDGFQIIVTGPAVGSSVIEASANLRNWRPIATNAVTVTGAEIVCPPDSGATMQFYRVRLVP